MSRKLQEFALRDELDTWVEQADAVAARRRLGWLALVALPFVLTLMFEWSSPRSETRFLLPWSVRTGPFAAGLRGKEHSCTGDLVELAGLPIYRGVDYSGPTQCTRDTDFMGYLDSGKALAIQRRALQTTWIVGASFATAGSRSEMSLGARLEARGIPRVLNRAWPGGGPVYGFQHLLSDKGPKLEAGQRVVWTLVQREIRASQFKSLDRAIDGPRISPPTRRKFVRRLRVYLEQTSAPRRFAREHNRFIVPARLDLGSTSRVQPARLSNGAPILFLDREVESSLRDWNAAGGERIAGVIERAHRLLETRGVELLVVLIPDRFAVYRDHIAVDDRGLTALDPPAERVPARLARELDARGVETIDLYATLHAHALSDPLPFRLDDTHWSDRGIDLAAEAIAERLRR